MCLCYIGCIKRDYSNSDTAAFIFIVLSSIYSVAGPNIVTFRKCITNSIKKFHMTVCILTFAQIILGLIILIFACINNKIYKLKIISISVL